MRLGIVEGAQIQAEYLGRLGERPGDFDVLRQLMQQALALGPLPREQESHHHETPPSQRSASAVQGSTRSRGPSAVRMSTCFGEAAQSASKTPPRGSLEKRINPRRGGRFNQGGLQVARLARL